MTITQEEIDAYLVTYEARPKRHARFRILEQVAAAVLDVATNGKTL